MNAPENKIAKSAFLKELFLSDNNKGNVTTLAILFATLIIASAAISASVYVSSSKPTELHNYSTALLFLYLVFPGLSTGMYLSAIFILNKSLRQAVHNEILIIIERIREH
jgi:hypothetical protein